MISLQGHRYRGRRQGAAILSGRRWGRGYCDRYYLADVWLAGIRHQTQPSYRCLDLAFLDKSWPLLGSPDKTSSLYRVTDVFVCHQGEQKADHANCIIAVPREQVTLGLFENKKTWKFIRT